VNVETVSKYTNACYYTVDCLVCFSGLLYSCGLNTYHPLGSLPVSEKCLAPKLVHVVKFQCCLSVCLSLSVCVCLFLYTLVQSVQIELMSYLM